MTQRHLLSVCDLRVEYKVGKDIVRAVDGASLDVPRGAIVGLVGESGCGKSTLARALTGIMPKSARISGGQLLFDGTDLLRLGHRRLNRHRWRDIAFVPQSAMNSLDPVYTIETQLAEILRQRGGLGRAETRERSAHLFELVGIEPRRLGDYPHQFSGGMRQRVAIAMALALEPKLVIADEPVTALDVIVQRQILDRLRFLQGELGMSVLLVTHDISVVAYVCDEIVVMYAGQVMEAGDARTVLTEPHHPYTMGLYNAFPDLQSSQGLLTPIEGQPPDLRRPPDGCRFAPRCPFVEDACRGGEVPLTPIDGGDHASACRRTGEAAHLRVKALESETWMP